MIRNLMLLCWPWDGGVDSVIDNRQNGTRKDFKKKIISASLKKKHETQSCQRINLVIYTHTHGPWFGHFVYICFQIYITIGEARMKDWEGQSFFCLFLCLSQHFKSASFFLSRTIRFTLLYCSISRNTYNGNAYLNIGSPKRCSLCEIVYDQFYTI